MFPHNNHNANVFAISHFFGGQYMVKMFRKKFMILGSILLLSFLITSEAISANNQLNILCSTFPVYQITRNVVQGSIGVKVELMLPSTLGCPHDYSLTPKDMQKISGADVLVINGLGLEDFIREAPLKANKRMIVIDSSSGIKDLLEYKDDDHGMPGHEQGHNHHHEGVNPHLFASPRMCGQLAMNIAGGLSKADPKGAEIYNKNGKAYALKMNRLADEVVSQVKKLENRNIVTQHGAFDYLARDAGLNIIAVIQSHPGQEPSASEMLSIINDVKKHKAGAIYYEPQYSSKAPQVIAKEAGIPAAMLDPVATGPVNAALNYYEIIMRKNIETLKGTLGRK
jgi:zinc transport system substrate-binding protein